MASGTGPMKKKKKPAFSKTKARIAGVKAKVAAGRKKKVQHGKDYDQWKPGEKLTKSGRESARRRKNLKKLAKIKKAGGKESVTWTQKEGSKHLYSKEKEKHLGSKATRKALKGAVGAEITEGGVYTKYKKTSKKAGSFRAAFKKGCAGGAKSFSWDGRSYSCKKK